MSTTAKKGSGLEKTVLVGLNRAEGETDNEEKDSVAAVPDQELQLGLDREGSDKPPAEAYGLQAPTPSNQLHGGEREDTPTVVQDLLADTIKANKEQGRVKKENLKMTTEE